MPIHLKYTFIFITLLVIISISFLQITSAELPKDFGKSHNSNRPSLPFGTMLKDKDLSVSPTPTSLSLHPSNIEHQENIISTMIICAMTVYHFTMHPSNFTAKPSSINDSGVMMIGEMLNRKFLEIVASIWLCNCLGFTNIFF